MRFAPSPPASARSGRVLSGAIVLAAAGAVAGLIGCGSSPTGIGDTTGTHLVAFASDRGHAAGQTDILLWDFDAVAFKDLPSLVNSAAAERHPALSSDGRFLAYQVDLGTGSGDDIYMYDRFTGQRVDLPGLNTADPETEPVFTGDGLKLCFVRGGATRRVKLYDGTTRQVVALPGIDALDPAFSDYSPAPNRDGSLIAFVSDRRGNPDIFIYSRARSALLDGPKLRDALVSTGDDLDPVFAAGNRFLAFSSDRVGSLGAHDLYLLEFTPSLTLVDTVLRDLSAANSGSDERHPTLSESGNIVVFQSNRAGGQGSWDLWNFDRSRSPALPPGQANGYDSAQDDIEPSIRWPF